MLVPPALTLLIFLILFNNLKAGIGILVALAVFDSAALLLCRRVSLPELFDDYVTIGLICTITAIVTVTAVELTFPIVFPGEYARVIRLSDAAHNADVGTELGSTTVFSNDDPRVYVGARGRGPDDAPPAQTWRKPGRVSKYTGYDPNEKMPYVNIVRWNSRGYYDFERPLKPKSGVTRIVIVGDSFVESAQVPLTKTFHKLLEDGLNEPGPNRNSRAKRFEVIALGTSGHGFRDHFETLEEEAVPYHPELVIMTAYLNDICDDDPHLARKRTVAAGEITREFRSLARHGLYALAFVRRRLNEIRSARMGISPEHLQWAAQDAPRVEAAREAMFGRILEAREFCRTRGIRFLLVYVGSEIEVHYAIDPGSALTLFAEQYPETSEHSWDLTKSERKLKAFCARHGIQFLSLVEPLAQARRNIGKHVFADHFTFFGHEVVGAALTEKVRDVVR